MRHGKIYRNFKGGPQRRMGVIRTLITALVKFERIETSFSKAHETQKYAERLIKIAKKGDKDGEAMQIADYYLKDKRQVHKLFKVLGERFQDKPRGFTNLLRTTDRTDKGGVMTFLEFKGNPYPSLQAPTRRRNPEWLLNVLVRGAMQDIQQSGVLQEEGYHPHFYGTRVESRQSTDRDFSDANLRNKLVNLTIDDDDDSIRDSSSEKVADEGTPV